MKAKAEKRKKEQVQTGTDYNEYSMNILEWLLYVIVAGACLFGVGYVFYQNMILSGILALIGLLYPKIRKKQIIANRKHKLNLQFKDMLYSLSSAVSAGNSVERAISITLEDMKQQYNDPNVFIIKELELMVNRIAMNRTIEEVLNDFAVRSHLEDVETFANIFEISKRTDGNIIEIIRNTTQIIADKIETQTEIETIIAGKKMEQKVLMIMPIGLVFFMTKSGGEFMNPIFNTFVGRIVATISLAVIILGSLWANKIADIKI